MQGRGRQCLLENTILENFEKVIHTRLMKFKVEGDDVSWKTQSWRVGLSQGITLEE